MIEIHTITNYDDIKKIYDECSILCVNYSMCVVATENDISVGNCLFRLISDKIYIADINPKNDISLADGMLRSALFVGVNHGAKSAFYDDTAPVNVLKLLDFIADEDLNTLKIEKLSEGCSSCEKNKNIT